ncbi:putative E3 ubiquitin-protein ligase RHC1A [Diplonema papillatum]|nr:putative E3 ubiquitin-protein ligase RHC1A [Diplonema papillatum]
MSAEDVQTLPDWPLRAQADSSGFAIQINARQLGLRFTLSRQLGIAFLNPNAVRTRRSALSDIIGEFAQIVHLLSLVGEEAVDKGPPPIDAADLSNLRKICVTPYHLKLSGNESCSICQDAFSVGEAAMQLPCGHIYCTACITEWLSRRRTCPMCREEIVDVPQPRWLLGCCGFKQLRKRECFAQPMSQALVVLPRCSHGFHRDCLRTHIRLHSRQKSDTLSLACPLCHFPSPISRADVAAPAATKPDAPPEQTPPVLALEAADQQPAAVVEARQAHCPQQPRRSQHRRVQRRALSRGR